MEEKKTMIRAVKIRLYPTNEQMDKIWKNIGASRFIWNYMLDLQNTRYEAGEKHLRHFDMCKVATELKNTEGYEWLKEVDSMNINTTCKDLDLAFRKFFNDKTHQVGYPKFKSRKTAKASYPTNYNGVTFYEDGVVLPKVGRVKYKTKKDIPLGREARKLFTNPRVTVNTKGNVILSLGVPFENEYTKLNDDKMGIDLGIKDLAIVAYGDEQYVYHNLNKSKYLRQLERKKRHIQKNISRKYEAQNKGREQDKRVYNKTNNIIKEEKKLKLLCEHITNIRNNYLHQTTRQLVNMKPSKITMEDLNVKGMMKNKHLAKSVAEQKFYEFRRQMTYKSEEYGIEIEFADRWYPSTQTCHNCGYVRKGEEKLTLKDRTFTCPVCGYTEDRDYNAAKNLRDYSPKPK